MYEMTSAQIESEKKLIKEGFQFSNWIDTHDPRDDDTDRGCMVFTKHPGPGQTEYREIDPDGSIN